MASPNFTVSSTGILSYTDMQFVPLYLSLLRGEFLKEKMVPT